MLSLRAGELFPGYRLAGNESLQRETGTDTLTRLSTCCALALAHCLVVGSSATRAQQPGPEDQAIDQIRQLSTIGANDQQRINDWVNAQVDKFTDFNAFRKRIGDQFTNAGNSALFPAALATQTAVVAAARAAAGNMKPDLAWSLAQSLYDMKVPETFPGFIGLLASKDARTRYICASGLSARSVKRAIAADKAKLDQAVATLRAVGSNESDSVVVGRIYEALAFPTKTADVFDAYLAVFDNRLSVRRRPGVVADGAERFAYAFFLQRNVVTALNANQKGELAKRVAVFMRIDAQRFNTPNLAFIEEDRIERTLWAAEELLSGSAMLGGKGGKIRTALQAGGPKNSAAVLEEVYKWVGHPTSNTPGALNAAPWSVPIGAP